MIAYCERTNNEKRWTCLEWKLDLPFWRKIKNSIYIWFGHDYYTIFLTIVVLTWLLINKLRKYIFLQRNGETARNTENYDLKQIFNLIARFHDIKYINFRRVIIRFSDKATCCWTSLRCIYYIYFIYLIIIWI